jgi:hypothetical protein
MEISPPERYCSISGDYNLSLIFEKLGKGKRNQIYHYWNERKSTYELVQSVANKTRLCQEDILYKVQVKPRVLIYCGHLEVAEDFKRWCEKPKKRNIEQRIQERLKKEHSGGKIGVTTDIGTIDFLTDGQLIEVKFFKTWKEGVGQLLLYGLEYETYQKVLHLYGKIPNKTQQLTSPQLRRQREKDGSNQVLTLELIQNQCKLLQTKHDFFNILVQWEDKLGTDLEDEDALEEEDSVQYNLSDFRIDTKLYSYKGDEL